MDEHDHKAEAAESQKDKQTTAEEVASKLLEDVGTKAGSRAATTAERAAQAAIESTSKPDVLRELQNFAEGHSKMRISPEAFLNKTERLVLNNLDSALQKGDLHSVQEALGAVGENPKSAKLIMNAIKERLEAANPRNSVRWETGTDSNGEAIVRLHILQDHGKGSGVTKVMVGSDGTHSASSVKIWDSSYGKQLDPSETLRELTTPLWHRLRPIPKPPFDVPLDIDRHYKEFHHQLDSIKK